MSERTGIEWTHHTFNIAWGCQKVSPGCAHCYADTLSRRYGHAVWGPAASTSRRVFGAHHWNEPRRWARRAAKDGVRRRVLCGSMCDVCEAHPTVEGELLKLWPLIRETPELDWLLLTKRPERFAGALPSDWGEGYRNVWLGTSVETQPYVERAAILAGIPAAVRFLSMEPLLGPVRLGLDKAPLAGRIHWVIPGGESGSGARAMDLDWVRALRDECAAAGVALYLKQLGGHPSPRSHAAAVLDGRRWTALPRPVL